MKAPPLAGRQGPWVDMRRGPCTEGQRGRARRPRQDWRALQGGERRKHQGVYWPLFNSQYSRVLTRLQ